MSPTQSSSNCVLNVPNAINCVVHMDINTIELCDVHRHTIELRYEHNPFEFFWVPKEYKIWKDCERNVSNKDYLDWDAPKLRKTLQQENWMGEVICCY